ncbi:TetR/AcrR family transcriptional regulator [Micromonospora zhanjiangensis]|uniref:TetR/AcrR family transcriptional regulator n=1 Tax=Micromonospora zhanjiangensis TaxID=1522057 RepID=A0ABV8KI34_9ACTN
MSPRVSVAAARRTRAAIVDRGVEVASREGLEGLTIGRLADDLAMSKSGLLGHFGSKEKLQLVVLDRAAEIFWREVWEPVADRPAGLARLRAVCGSWIGYLERGVFPGGCFFIAATAEFDDRPGPVRDAVAEYARRWQRELSWQIQRAVTAGELDPRTDPDQVVFELIGIVTAVNQTRQLHRDPAAPQRGRRAVDRLLDHFSAPAGAGAPAGTVGPPSGPTDPAVGGAPG